MSTKNALVGLLILIIAAAIYYFVKNCTKEKPGKPSTDVAKGSIPGDGKALFTQHCGSCHMQSDPKHLPKETWKSHVLPMMALKMGFTDSAYERSITAEEREIEKKHHLIPDQPVISRADYDKISAYIIDNAPDSISYAAQRVSRSKNLTQFQRREVQLSTNKPSLVTALKYNPQTQVLWIGNMNNEVLNWQFGKGVVNNISVQSPVTHFNFHEGNTFFYRSGRSFAK